MTPIGQRAWLIAGLLAGLLAVIAFAGQAKAPPAPFGTQPSAEAAIFIDMRTAVPSRAAAMDALLHKAKTLGQVRVIAGLGITLQTGDALNDTQIAEQMTRLHAEQNAAAVRAGVPPRYVTQFDYIPFVSMWVTPAQLTRLLADRSIVNIQEDVPGKAGLNKSAPFINADKVWKQSFKGNGFTIAILDTGIDETHPMLAGRKIVSEACYSTNNAGQGISSLCPRGATKSMAVGSGVNCPLSIDPCWHGTHVAGIAAGKPVKESATTALAGIAPIAKLISIQVFSAQGGSAVTFDSDWILGLERVYALRNKYRIAAVNISFGSGKFTGPCDKQNPAAKKIIRQLRNVRIAVIAASMNDGYDNATEEPACISEVIAVGATLHTANTLATYSNNAPWVRLLAPGSGIVSAKAGGGFKASDGTSMAAPHVAGAFALLRNVYGKATVDDVAAALECTGPLVTRAGISKPRIDVLAAKAYLLSPPSTVLDFTFDAGAPGWASNLGNWHAFGGFLSIGNFQAGYKVATIQTCNEGQDITAQGIQRSGATNLGDIQGILFKAQFAADSTNALTIMSGYVAGYSRSGTASIRRFDDYDLVHSSGTIVTLCNGTANLSGNGSETLEVQTRGGTHTFVMNGKTICVAKDRTYGTGSGGVLGHLATLDTTNGLSVDRFTVQPVETTPPSSSAAESVTAAEP